VRVQIQRRVVAQTRKRIDLFVRLGDGGGGAWRDRHFLRDGRRRGRGGLPRIGTVDPRHGASDHCRRGGRGGHGPHIGRRGNLRDTHDPRARQNAITQTR
jgi:hypothetical protein